MRNSSDSWQFWNNIRALQTDLFFFVWSVNVYVRGGSSTGLYEKLFSGSCMDKSRDTPICSVWDQKETGFFLRHGSIHLPNRTVSRPRTPFRHCIISL